MGWVFLAELEGFDRVLRGLGREEGGEMRRVEVGGGDEEGGAGWGDEEGGEGKVGCCCCCCCSCCSSAHT